MLTTGRLLDQLLQDEAIDEAIELADEAIDEPTELIDEVTDPTDEVMHGTQNDVEPSLQYLQLLLVIINLLI